MSHPRTIHLLVQVTSQLETFLVGLLVTVGIVSHRIILLGTIGSRHQMEHGIIAFAKLVAARAALGGDVLPHLRRDIGRDVHCTTVAHHEGRLRASLCQSHKRVFQRQLRLQDSQFALVIELGVRRQVAPATLTVHSGNLWDGKHLETQIGKMLNDAH